MTPILGVVAIGYFMRMCLHSLDLASLEKGRVVRSPGIRHHLLTVFRWLTFQCPRFHMNAF